MDYPDTQVSYNISILPKAKGVCTPIHYDFGNDEPVEVRCGVLDMDFPGSSKKKEIDFFVIRTMNKRAILFGPRDSENLDFGKAIDLKTYTNGKCDHLAIARNRIYLAHGTIINYVTMLPLDKNNIGPHSEDYIDLEEEIIQMIPKKEYNENSILVLTALRNLYQIEMRKEPIFISKDVLMFDVCGTSYFYIKKDLTTVNLQKIDEEPKLDMLKCLPERVHLFGTSFPKYEWKLGELEVMPKQNRKIHISFCMKKVSVKYCTMNRHQIFQLNPTPPDIELFSTNDQIVSFDEITNQNLVIITRRVKPGAPRECIIRLLENFDNFYKLIKMVNIQNGEIGVSLSHPLDCQIIFFHLQKLYIEYKEQNRNIIQYFPDIIVHILVKIWRNIDELLLSKFLCLGFFNDIMLQNPYSLRENSSYACLCYLAHISIRLSPEKMSNKNFYNSIVGIYEDNTLKYFFPISTELADQINARAFHLITTDSIPHHLILLIMEAVLGSRILDKYYQILLVACFRYKLLERNVKLVSGLIALVYAIPPGRITAGYDFQEIVEYSLHCYHFSYVNQTQHSPLIRKNITRFWSQLVNESNPEFLETLYEILNEYILSLQEEITNFILENQSHPRSILYKEIKEFLINLIPIDEKEGIHRVLHSLDDVINELIHIHDYIMDLSRQNKIMKNALIEIKIRERFSKR